MRKLSMIAAMLMLALLAVPATAGEDAPEGHGDKDTMLLPGGMQVELVELKAGNYAYLEGTMLGNMDELFGKLVGLGTEQGLIGDETKFGSVYPADMSQGVDEESPVYVGFSIPDDTEVAEPLLLGTLDGGVYLKVEHWGDYAGLEHTYTALYEWAAKKGIEFGIPSFEHYVTDPEVTPMEEWLTEIYFPFEHEPMKGMHGEQAEYHNQFEGQHHENDGDGHDKD